MNLNTRFAFPVEYVTDIDAAKQFYVDTFGYRVERDHPAFVQLRATDGTAYAIATDAPSSEGAKLELYWEVDDVKAAHDELSQKAEISMPLSQLPFGTVFGVKDPAGQPRYLLQWAAERPSQTVE